MGVAMPMLDIAGSIYTILDVLAGLCDRFA